MVWSSLSSSGGGLTPGYLNGACSNVYCHGGAFAASVKGVATAPTWTNGNYLAGTGKAGADCNQCHQSPPLSSAKFDHSGYTLASDCAGCHNHNGTGAAHINGLLEASGSCNGCHAYPPYPGDGMTKPADVSPEGKGAHVKHVSHLEARWLVSHPGDPLNASTDSFGSAKFQFICGACHNGATHRMTSTTAADRTIAIDPKYLFSSGTPTYNGRPGTTSASYPKTCSNVSCHFTASPGWQNPAVPE
jgi:predicted CxxxxCH...CXXCH cytochrome family protein